MKDKVIQFLSKFERKTIIITASSIAFVIVIAILIATLLNMRGSAYTILFQKTSKEDATSIMRLLNDNNIAYKYEDDGNILVQKNEKDKAMALIAVDAYPTSGFAYELSGKAGSMATDSDKQRYAIYDLQNRLGATIKMFAGVQDAKVTIAVGEQNKYVLSDDENIPASASVVVKMKDGGAPSRAQVIGIQKLLSKSIRGITMDNVAVIDGNGDYVSVVTDDENDDNMSLNNNVKGGNSIAEIQSSIAGIIEKHISNNVKNVFTALFGQGNVAVSVRADINMESVMKESISYSVPNDIDKKDKRGLIVRESGQQDATGAKDGAEGVVGTEVNSEVTEYNAGTNKNKNTTQDYAYAREYLVNQVKEQGSLPSGSVKDLTVSVVINSENKIPNNELIDLAGTAAGIKKEDRVGKITVVYTNTSEAKPVDENKGVDNSYAAIINRVPYWAWAILGAVILLVILFIISMMRRKKKLLLALQLEAINAENNRVHQIGLPPIEQVDRIEDDEKTLFVQDDRGMGLRKDVRDFADKNPEIAARLLKTWLSGGEENG